MASLSTRAAWQDWRRLVDALEMTSQDDLDEFIKSALFSPFWEELLENAIKPRQKEAEEKNTSRARGPDLRATQTTLIQGEKGGARKFSAKRPDKSGWTPKDHYAYFLYNVRDENINNNDGIFFGKGLDDAEVDTRIWSLLQRMSFDNAPSRRVSSKGAKLTGGDTAKKSRMQASEKATSKKATPVAQAGVDPDVIELAETPAIFRDDSPLPPFPPREHQQEAHSLEPRIKEESSPGPELEVEVNPLDNATRMYEERTSNTMDVNDRYWRKTMMDIVAKKTGGWEAVVASGQHLYADDRMTNALSIAWEEETRKLNEDDNPIYAPLSQNAIIQFDQQQRLFNNLNYQRQNVEEACENLGIENPQLARMREESRERAKPFLVVVPVKLLDQWIEEIRKILPRVSIYKYYGDRRAKSIGGEIIIDKILTRKHSLFSGAPQNASAIIITTYGTLAYRHGVRAQYHWRVRHGQWNKTAAKKHEQDYDHVWPEGIAGQFDTVVLDEAHIIKNAGTDVHTAVRWLDAGFHLFLSATPLLAGARDFAGFLKLIEPSNSEELWSADSLNAMGLDDEEVNSLHLEEYHPGNILCATIRSIGSA
ncbi:MAG: hypothetical protein M1830_006198 [Pleopsidium flavum]|nr:MAG: hypothetical protein M1830_006198 [Pleopsidium flavum]